MTKKIILIGAVISGMLALTGYGLYSLGTQHGEKPVQKAVTTDPSQWGIAEGEAATRRHLETGLKAGDLDPETGREILYYHDPMTPGRKFGAPGKSPFMDMMLVPAYAVGQSADTNAITISPRVQQNLGIRTGEVMRGNVAAEVSTVGTVTWNERTEVTVQARATGFVEELHVGAALDPVAQGQPLLDLYVPDWVAVQEEYRALRRMEGQDLDVLISAAQQRMRQVGMTSRQIEQIEKNGALQARLQLTAPISGLVTELLVREGSTVMAGAPLMRINHLTTVWAEAAVPESQTSFLSSGSPVTATAPALPGETFSGEIQTLLPDVDPVTRTRRARVELANPDGRLVPGTLVQMTLRATESRSALLLPTEALIRTGARTLVMVVDDGGNFRPVAVEAGEEINNYSEVLGLAEGQKVVLSGQFLLDSEASLRGIDTQRMNANDDDSNAHLHNRVMPTDEPTVGVTSAALYTVTAEVKAQKGETLTLRHGKIPALDWPAMTMDFELAADLPKADIPLGEQIEIEFRLPEEGPPEIVRWRSLGEAP